MATGDNGTQWTPIPAGYIGRAVSGEYAAPARGGTTTGTIVLNQQFFMFLPIVAACTLDRIGVEVQTGVAATTVRLGIYAPDGPSGRPGSVLLDTGALDTSVTGSVEATIAQPVTPPGVWLTACRQSASSATYRLQNAGTQQVYTRSTLTTLTQFALCCFTKAGISGAFAASPTGLNGDVAPPIICVRYA